MRGCRCFAPATWTVPSVTTMMTGISPDTHRVGLDKWKIPPSSVTLAEILRQAGYVTGSVSQNPYTAPNADLDRGFDVVDQSKISFMRLPADAAPADEPNVRAWSRFLDNNADKPFFLCVHTLEAHGPYKPPKRFRLFKSENGQEGTIDRYDDGIAWTDANLSLLVAKLKELGLWQFTLLIVNSDHGQSFAPNEGGPGHGGKPYLARVHVPLVMHLPGLISPGLVIEDNVQLLDVPPTILSLLKIPVPAQFQGRSLAPLFKRLPIERRRIFCVGERPAWHALVSGDWFFFYDDGKSSLFDIKADPGQMNDVAGSNQLVVDQLDKQLLAYLDEQRTLAAALRKSDQPETPISIDAEIAEQLKALGYVH